MSKGLNKLSLYTLMFFVVSCVSADERILSHHPRFLVLIKSMQTNC